MRLVLLISGVGLMASVWATGCGMTVEQYDPKLAESLHNAASGERDLPVVMDASLVTYTHARRDVSVGLRTENPDFVYRLRWRTIGSKHIRGTRIYRMKMGQALQQAAPLVWQKYLGVRMDPAAGLHVVEMAILSMSGEAVHDLAKTEASGGDSQVSYDMSLTLRCRLLAPGGREVASLSSTRRISCIGEAAPECSFDEAAPRVLAEAFDGVLAEFFADNAVRTALGTE
ncbi:MAG TPA: hypothetical protein VM031_04560 [Phycisphaerae bacterium]|nr:hypothetical protein [Phycisphaerae bacterium]